MKTSISSCFSHRTQRVLIICAIFAVFFCIVLLNITRTSVWGDEGFSVMTIGGGNGVNASMENFWNLIMADNHPFLYNFLLYFYAKVFGYSDGVLRFFSTLWICVGGMIGYFLLRKYRGGGEWFSLLYLIFFMLAPNTIYYAQELRNYGMILGLSSIFCVLYFLIREYLYNRFETQHIKTYFFSLVCIGVALILTHYYAYIFLFSAGCALLFESFVKKKLFLITLGSFVFIGIVGIVWLFLHCYMGGFHLRITGASNGDFWTYDRGLTMLLLSIVLSMLGKYGWGAVLFALSYAVLMCFKSLKQYIKFYSGLCLPVVLEMIIAAGIFTVLTKTVVVRYFMELYPFAYLFIALVLNVGGKRIVPFIFLIVVCLIGHSVFLSKTYEKEDIHSASVYVESHFDKNACKLPVGWISYARYLPNFEVVERPLLQDGCDLILLSVTDIDDVAQDFNNIRSYLAKYDITNGYCIVEFNNAVLVFKDNYQGCKKATNIQ